MYRFGEAWAIFSLRPETRISKNSSRFPEQMHKKRILSNRGSRSFRASDNTRSLKARALKSRLIKYFGLSKGSDIKAALHLRRAFIQLALMYYKKTNSYKGNK